MGKRKTLKEFNALPEYSKKALYILSGLKELAEDGIIPDFPVQLDISKEVKDHLATMRLTSEEMAAGLQAVINYGLLPFAKTYDDLVSIISFGGADWFCGTA